MIFLGDRSAALWKFGEFPPLSYSSIVSFYDFHPLFD